KFQGRNQPRSPVMTRIQVLIVLALYLIGAAVCTQRAISLDKTWVLGLVLWTSFFGLCNAVFWMADWSREHWMGRRRVDSTQSTVQSVGFTVPPSRCGESHPRGSSVLLRGSSVLLTVYCKLFVVYSPYSSAVTLS